MVNFTKLRHLINEVENRKESDHYFFYQQLHNIAESELRQKQSNLNAFFV